MRRKNRSLEFDVECLESRQLLATFTVTSLDDGEVTAIGDQPGTLRQAIFDANASAGADVIEFRLPSGPAGVIQLDVEGLGGFLRVTDDLTINGLGEDALFVRAAHESSILVVNNADLQINRMSLLDGENAYSGGAISVFGGDLTLTDVTLTGNSSGNRGGAIYGASSASVHLVRSTLAGNHASRGGAISATNLSIVESQILNNSAQFAEGGISVRGTFSLVDSEVSGNSTLGSAGGLSASGSATIIRSRIANNLANIGGGLQFSGAGSLTIEDTELTGNEARVQGGGASLRPVSTQISIRNTTISGNRAERPGDHELKGRWALYRGKQQSRYDCEQSDFGQPGRRGW